MAGNRRARVWRPVPGFENFDCGPTGRGYSWGRIPGRCPGLRNYAPSALRRWAVNPLRISAKYFTNDNYWRTLRSRGGADSFFHSRMNLNIHWREDTTGFEKAETPHALDALHAQESHFFCD